MHRIGPLATALLLLISLFSSNAAAQGLALEDIVDGVQEAFDSDQGPIAQGANWVLVDSPADTEPELEGRDLVVVVHGFGNDYLELDEGIHPTWAGLRFALGATVLTGDDLFENKKIVYYQYLPTRPYDELGAEFAAVISQNYPDAAPIIVAHSAGALLARHAAQSLPVKAVIGIAPADHGTQAASFMVASEDLSDLLGEDHASTIVAARDRFEVSDEVLESLAWDNTDGVLEAEDASEYGIPVGEYPAMDYTRFAHYGIVEDFRPDVIQLINDGFEDGAVERDAAEFAALASYDEAWMANDGAVAPAEGPGEDTDRLRYYDDVRHAEMLFNPAVLQAVVHDIDEALSLAPSEPEEDDDEGDEGDDDDATCEDEDGSWMSGCDDESDPDDKDESDDDDDTASEDDDEEEKPRKKKRRRRSNSVNVGTNNGVIQSSGDGGTNVYIESMEVIGKPGKGDEDEDDAFDAIEPGVGQALLRAIGDKVNEKLESDSDEDESEDDEEDESSDD